MGFNNATKKARVVSAVIKSRQTKLPTRLQWTVLGSLVTEKRPGWEDKRPKSSWSNVSAKKLRVWNRELMTGVLWVEQHSYPSSLSPSMSQCLPLVVYFQDSSRGHSQSLSQITHITTRTCLDSGLSGVVDSVVDTLGAPEWIRVVKL